MQAYATSERLPLGDLLPTLDQSSPASARQAAPSCDSAPALVDQVLSRLADLIAERLMAHTAANIGDRVNEWLDARSAAAYLGIHRDTLRKLAAQRAIPAHQDGPRCRLYFCRDELDEWRRTARSTRTSPSRLRAVS